MLCLESRTLKSEVDETKSQLSSIKTDLSKFQSDDNSVTTDDIRNRCNLLKSQTQKLLKQKKQLANGLSKIKQRIASYDEYWLLEDLSMRLECLKNELNWWDLDNELQAVIEEIPTLLDHLSMLMAEKCHQEKFDCPICQDTCPIDDVFEITLCNHKLCLACARQLVQQDLKSGQFPLVCPMCKANPCKNCPCQTGKQANADNPNEKFCELLDNDLDLVLEGDEKARYNRIQMDFVSNSCAEYIHCPNEDCRQIFWAEPNETDSTCLKCGHRFCAKCLVDWHDGYTCDQYQDWKKQNDEGDEVFKKMKEEGKIKECPNCNKYGMKECASQCNAIWCKHCAKTFCWLCLKPLNYLSNPHQHFSEQGDCYGKCFEGVHG